MKILAILVAMCFGFSAAPAQVDSSTRENPLTVLEQALSVITPNCESLLRPFDYKAELAIESVNENDGRVVETVVETQSASEFGGCFRTDHEVVRPEKGPMKFEIRYYRYYRPEDKLWRLDFDPKKDVFHAAVCPKEIEELKAFPRVIRVLIYFMAKPDEFPHVCKALEDGTIDGKAYRCVEMAVGANDPKMTYRIYIDRETGTIRRVVYVNTGTVSDFTDWRKFGEFMLPATVASGDGGNSFRSSIRLVDLKVAPELPEGWFQLPENLTGGGR
jgi:hypothetical protein